MQQDSAIIKARYDRIAPYFDVLESLMERVFMAQLRHQIWRKVTGATILEAGVGTGKNFLYYAGRESITAIDFSEKMLARAARKRDKLQLRIDLQIMDVQALDFPDNSFDTVIATFLFCSVPDPAQGLKELHRVCKPGGQVLLLEHVLSEKPWLAALMNWLNPLIVRLFGANINRRTVSTVESIGFQSVHVDTVSGGIVKLIEAKK